MPNNKQITMTEIQNPKQKKIAFEPVCWDLFVIWYLEFVISKNP